MTMHAQIEEKVRQGLQVQHLQIENESHLHRGPATDSHFKLVVVSDDFEGKRAVARHQQIYGLLAEEMQGPVHALVMHLYTGEEWQQRQGEVPASAACRGTPAR
ncbi:BolA family transcriptional regulator [Motiliproteus sp. SC1-56]|uniref:BolA family protein n=1 Tax=Motiliproteus sp. SC1-56 TaxID=2799565 RepID=UPI001A8D7FB7|nr:BolA/IbaG family iron-sulfur metabolism protein [Motiliproteus sp. SC1-56]